MRYLLLAALLVVGGLATTASAQEAIGVSDFTVGSDGQLSGTGTLGGVQGTMTSTVTAGDCTTSCNGTWVMTVGSANFAGGTFTCDNSACIYMGSIAADSSTGFAISTISSPIGTEMAGSIYTHGMWVSDVTRWANLHADVISGLNMTVADFISNASNDRGSQ
jgi:hypothetical protein